MPAQQAKSSWSKAEDRTCAGSNFLEKIAKGFNQQMFLYGPAGYNNVI
jgi:hypothetical protein